jgi:hypothetical protein
MKRGRLVVAMALAGLVGAAVPTLAASYHAASPPRIVSGTARDALRERHVSVDLSATGGQKVRVLSFTLPAGSWVLSAEATLVNFGPATYARCQITADGVQIASGTTTIGDSSLPGANAEGTTVAARGLLGSVRSSTSFSAALKCWHDESTPAGQPVPYVDPGAVVWAHRSSDLDGTTS